MSQLQERILLWNAFKFVFPSLFLVALLSSFFPFMQAVVPVHEAESCICIFMMSKEMNKGWYPILNLFESDHTAINSLVFINTTSFYMINWFFLMLNICAIYSIRKMKDRLDIRLEMTWVVALWSFFDLL